MSHATGDPDAGVSGPVPPVTGGAGVPEHPGPTIEPQGPPAPAASAAAEQQAAAVPAAATGPAPEPPEPRRWLRRRRKPRAAQESPTEPVPPEVVVVAPTSLLNRSPFHIGFVGAVGALLAFLLAGAVVTLQSVLILTVLALFVALGLNPLVERLQRLRLPRGAAVAIVAVSLFVVVVLAVWAIVPVVTEQVNLLITNIPIYLEGLRENPTIAALDAEYGIIDRATEALTSGAWLEWMFGGLLGASRVVANVLFSLFITVVLTMYFLGSLPSIKHTIYSLAPASRRGRTRYLANETFRRIGGYMGGLFTVVIMASTVAFLYLNIVGLGEYALALTVVVALFAFIPIVGPTTSAIILSLVAFSQSTTLGVVTLAFFLTYQQIDAYVFQPRIYSKSVNVPGALVVIAAISGGFLFGIVGALLAIPTVASLLLLYREVLQPHLDRT